MIYYRAGYKYQLAEDYTVVLSPGLRPSVLVKTEFIDLGTDGVLTIRRGYAWDGPSGPAIDTRTGMRGSLVHDALYQLLRGGLLPPWCRALIDRLLEVHCREDGMWRLRARWWYRGVRLGGGPAADPLSAKPVLTAP